MSKEQDKEWEVMFNLLQADIPDPWQGAKGIEVMITDTHQYTADEELPF